MDKQDMNRLRELANKATKGEWAHDNFRIIATIPHNGSAFVLGGLPESQNNVRYAAAAQPSAILALLDKVEALEKERYELAAKLAALENNKPVAWRVHPYAHGVENSYEGVYALTMRDDQVAAWKRKGWCVEPLYAAPQPAQSADDQEPVAYLHRMEKTTELSFFGESAECTGRKDWIGFVPLFTRANTRFPSMLDAQPAAVPEGWPTDDMVVIGGEVVGDALRAEGVYIDFDINLSGSEIKQRIAESVFVSMLAAAPQPSKEQGDD